VLANNFIPIIVTALFGTVTHLIHAFTIWRSERDITHFTGSWFIHYDVALLIRDIEASSDVEVSTAKARALARIVVSVGSVRTFVNAAVEASSFFGSQRPVSCLSNFMSPASILRPA
jgi:hypothetical protein